MHIRFGVALYFMPISNSETVLSETEDLIPVCSKSLFFKMHNVFKNRTTFSILIWLYENTIGLNVEDVIAGFSLSRSSAFRYCRMLADANVVESIWDVTEKDIRSYARNRFVISEYGRVLIETLFALEKTTQPIKTPNPKFEKEWSLRSQVSQKLDKRLAQRLADHKHTKRFEDLIFNLMREKYADIKDRTVYILWSREGPNAVIVWSKDKMDSIRCNISVTRWPEQAIIGLLTHELSHISLGTDLHDELQADEDVISRGLGHYLAIERVVTNKISDYVLREEKDRYLGYTSIRERLKPHNVKQLDKLLTDLGIQVDVD